MDNYWKTYLAVAAVAVAIAFVGLHIKKLNGYRLDREKKILVQWCAIPFMYHRTARGFDLYEYVEKAQLENSIKPDYCILDEREWEVVKSTIEDFRQELIRKYAYDEIYVPKVKGGLSQETFFLYSLLMYLKERTTNEDFCRKRIFKERLEYEEYGRWGSQLFYVKYSLTDYAVSIYKLYYVLFIYCKNKGLLKPEGAVKYDERSLQEVLETKTVSVEKI